MKTLFTKRIKIFLLRYHAPTGALSVLLLLLIRFSVPTELLGPKYTEGIVESMLISSAPTTTRAIRYGGSWIYDIKLKEYKGIVFRSSAYNEIRKYGVDRIINHKVEFRHWDGDEYKRINRFKINNHFIQYNEDITFFPFILFVFLFPFVLIWFLWGFYITYFADEKRKEILEL